MKMIYCHVNFKIAPTRVSYYNMKLLGFNKFEYQCSILQYVTCNNLLIFIIITVGKKIRLIYI